MRAILGPEYPAFEAALQETPPVSIRYNPRKTSGPVPHLERIPWHPDGFYLPERPVFTLDPLLHAGAYYVQEASSMFLYEAVRQSVDLSKPLKVLDLCAAPGGKSSLLAALLGPDSLLVANEVIQSRVGVLRENLERWGVPNVAVASADSEVFAELGGWFDLIVTDAPCSGEGLFRKDEDAQNEWSPSQVGVCAARQRRILAAAAAALAPGGVLVYSTCTYNHVENQDNAAWVAREFGLEPQALQVPDEWGIAAAGSGYQCFPHRVRGEGFFLSVLKKNAGETARQAIPSGFKSLKPLPKSQAPELQRWLADAASFRFFQTPGGDVLALPAVLENDYLILDKLLKNKWFGVNIGEFKGRDFVPSHALALSWTLSPELPRVAFSREQALLFLKKETFGLPAGTPQGWALATFEGLPLGWMKVLPNRMNNYLPAERRIRMELR